MPEIRGRVESASYLHDRQVLVVRLLAEEEVTVCIRPSDFTWSGRLAREVDNKTVRAEMEKLGRLFGLFAKDGRKLYLRVRSEQVERK